MSSAAALCSPTHRRRSQMSPTCILPLSYSSSGMTLAWLLSIRCRSSGPDCSSMGSPQRHMSHQEPGLLWASHRITASFSMGSFRHCRFHGNSMGYSDQCLNRVLTTGCWEIPAPASPPPPSLLSLESAELLVSYILTPVSGIC